MKVGLIKGSGEESSIRLREVELYFLKLIVFLNEYNSWLVFLEMIYVRKSERGCRSSLERHNKTTYG